ncbi:pyridoxamine 5'-phosphate oxidase family protein [Paraglaciecola sp. 25GB23A]|uniref:pyridoxamine 5'-phosphate oxidase family protein n=1 Tax=Paraglaciecola sp. 25GB23A TaxID=3156068 RepID=UPI0032AF04D9
MSNELKNRLWKIMHEQGSVMVGLSKNDEHSEPMHAQVDEDIANNLWIFTTKDNRVAEGGSSTLQFVAKNHDIFACLRGQLIEEKDKTMLDKFWSSGVEAWYENGKTDKNLLLMRFELESAEIWTQEPSITGMLKLSTGAKVSASELGEHTLA